MNSSAEINQEFVPQVIKLCEYSFFFENMKEAADIRTNKVSDEELVRCY